MKADAASQAGARALKAGQLRGAIIGCGFFAQRHLEAWTAIDDAALVAVCDHDPAKACAAAEKTGAKAYTNPATMFAENELDFVDIATGMRAHEALAQLAASYGVAMLVQKPIAPNWAEAVAIVEAAQTAGCPLMIHENFRFQPAMRRAGEIVLSGEIGTVTWTQISFRGDFDFYANQPYLRNQEELVLLEVGVHLTDMARYFAGEAKSIYGIQQQLGLDIVGEDQATLLTEHTGGAVSVIDMSFRSHRPRPTPFAFTATVEGTEGGLIVDEVGRLTIRSGNATRTEDLTRVSPLDSITSVFRHFCNCVRSGMDPETSGRDNLRSFAMVLAGYESMRGTGPVIPRQWAG